MVVALCSAGLASPAGAHEMSEREATKLLRSDEVTDRVEALEHLMESAPPPALMPVLLGRAVVEKDPGVYRRMLRLLGKSGFVEARPLIDRHILSPDGGLRSTARDALADWLRANRLLGPDQELPEPPHPAYGPPPPLPPTVPGGRSLQAILGGGSTTEDGREWPPPRYFPPPPGAPWGALDDELRVAPGFLAEPRPHPAPLAVGLGLFGAGWLVSIVFVAVAGAFVGTDAGPGAIPLVGPFIALGTSEDVEESGGLEALMVGSGVAQVLGVAIFPLAFVFDRYRVVPAPGGATVAIDF